MVHIISKTKGLIALTSISVAMVGISGANASSLLEINEADLPIKYIVKFKENSAPFVLSDGALVTPDEARETLLKTVKAREVDKLGSEPTYSVEIDEKDLTILRNNKQVEYVEVDPPRFLLSETTPWGYEAVNANMLEDSNAGNRTVCIIDSGYDLSHNDLSGNRVNGTNDNGTGSWSSPGHHNAHGTHVAGTIAAIANNDGVKGIMPNQHVNLHIVKVFNESGWGYSSSLVKAIKTCADNGANVVNMSLGGSQSSRTEERALKSLYDQDVLLVAASGNSGNTAYSYPASYDSVMSVAAVDTNNDHAAFSQATDQVDIAAPGVAVLSTVTLGEGVLSDITINGSSYFDRGIVPHNRLIKSHGQYTSAPVANEVTGELATCDISSGYYSCRNMSGKICLTERIDNQNSRIRPEINPVRACYNAGATAAIVYSNQELPGLQNPFLLDKNNNYRMVSVSVDRALGKELSRKTGETVKVSTTTGEDYQYYNGTSMATPHVTGVAGLVWSYHPTCTSKQVRKALTATATDIDVAGKDNRTGYGLINAKAAKEYLDAGCDGNNAGTTDDNVLKNGVEKTPLSGTKNSSTIFTFDVPADATKATFKLDGGQGDADMYVRFEGIPSTKTYDCRSWNDANHENCTLDVSETGTYQILLDGYSAYSGTTLIATHNGSAINSQAPSSYNNTNVVAIPDNSSKGATSEIDVLRSGDAGMVTIKLDIRHSYIGDLKVTLTSPTGGRVVLHDNTGDSANNIQQNYQVNYNGYESKGRWKLKAVDSARQDKGKINSWSLSFQ